MRVSNHHPFFDLCRLFRERDGMCLPYLEAIDNKDIPIFFNYDFVSGVDPTIDKRFFSPKRK
jgi:hypothetical protein